jgi:hypothetical protein
MVKRALLIACAAAAACTPDFQSASQVTDLRVLAIRAQPPEAMVDFARQEVQAVEVEALIVDPNPRATLTVRGRVCFPTDSGRCDTPPIEPTNPLEQPPRFMLDARNVPPEFVAAAVQDDRLKGFGGIRVQFSMDADDGDPHGKVEASKILLYSTAPSDQRNRNPEITRVEITRDGAPVGTVLPGGTLALVPGVEYGIRPVAEPIEEYDTLDLSGQNVHLREAPRYSFFGTAPLEFDRDEADEPLSGQVQPTNGIARVTLQSASTAMMWVVVRDGRGGVAWIGVRCDAG